MCSAEELDLDVGRCSGEGEIRGGNCGKSDGGSRTSRGSIAPTRTTHLSCRSKGHSKVKEERREKDRRAIRIRKKNNITQRKNER